MLILIAILVTVLAAIHWLMKHVCNMLEIWNPLYRRLLFFFAVWATWDWFQVDPVIWYSRHQFPDGHGNHQIMWAIFLLIAGRYLWVMTRHWWATPPKSIRAHDAGHDIAQAFANKSLFRAPALRSADPAVGPGTEY